MTAWRLPDDGLMTARWLPDDGLKSALQLLIRLSDDYPDDFHLIAWHLPDNCLMTAWLFLDHCRMTAWGQPDICLTSVFVDRKYNAKSWILIDKKHTMVSWKTRQNAPLYLQTPAQQAAPKVSPEKNRENAAPKTGSTVQKRPFLQRRSSPNKIINKNTSGAAAAAADTSNAATTTGKSKAKVSIFFPFVLFIRFITCQPLILNSEFTNIWILFTFFSGLIFILYNNVIITANLNWKLRRFRIQNWFQPILDRWHSTGTN